jgi:serine phosphatase RsbU (regulator of sigma subunit)
VVTWQNNSIFRDILDKQIQEDLLVMVQRSSSTIDSFFEVWRSLLHALMHNFDQNNLGNFEKQVSAILSSNKEVVSIEILKIRTGSEPQSLVFRLTPYVDSPLFQGYNSAQLSKDLRVFSLSKFDSVEKRQKIASKNSDVYSPLLKREKRILVLRVPFVLEKQDVSFHVFLSVWNDRTRAALGASKDVKSILIERSGAPVLTSEIAGKSIGVSSFAGSEAFRDLMQSASSFGQKLETTQEGRIIMRSFSMLRDQELAVVMERDTTFAYKELDWRVRKISLFAWIIIIAGTLAVYPAMGGATRHIFKTVDATRSIASGEFSVRVVQGKKDEIGLLGHAVNHMADQIHKLFLFREQAARLEKELITAQAVQRTLLPKRISNAHPIIAKGYYRSASECAGDWWNCFYLDEKRTLVVIADATGHGAHAALIVAIAYGFFEEYVRSIREGRREIETLPEVFTRFNSALLDSGGGQSTMTLFAMVVNSDLQEIEYCNGGHLSPMHLSAPKLQDVNGEQKLTVQSRSMLGSGSVLGMGDNPKFETRKQPFSPGDRIVLYTDGLIECESVQKTVISPKQLRNKLVGFAQDESTIFVTTFIDFVTSHFGNLSLNDDVTFVVVEFNPHYEANSENLVLAAPPGVNESQA